MSAESSHAEVIERLDKQRNRLLAWFIGTFFLWVLSSVVYTAIHLLSEDLDPETGYRLSTYLVAIPVIPWALFLFMYWRVRNKIISNSALSSALNDEIVQQAWQSAAAKGFWVMLIVGVIFEVGLGFSNASHAFLGAPDLSMLWGFQSTAVIASGVGVTIVTFLRARQN